MNAFLFLICCIPSQINAFLTLTRPLSLVGGSTSTTNKKIDITLHENAGTYHGTQICQYRVKRPLIKTFMASTPTDTNSSFDCNLTEEQTYFTIGYLNKHHRDLLINFVTAFTEIGTTKKKKNAFSGGSFKITDAEIIEILPVTSDLKLRVRTQIRGKAKEDEEIVMVPLDSMPFKSAGREFVPLPLVPLPLLKSADSGNYNHVDYFVRRMNRLCKIVNREDVTGKFIQLGIQIGGDKIGEIKDDLYLNQVPHNRFVRQYFYDMISKAVLDAVILCSEKKISNRMKLTAMFPEMNPSMDSYRIGTLLELVRDIAIKLAEQNVRVRVCVQGSMGVGIFTGVPKQLSGVSTLLQRMDWQSGEGEENEGMVGNYVNFGAVGKEHVVNKGVDRKGNPIEQDDVFIIICPQSMVGVESSIIGALSEMTDATGDRPIILINPDLTDKPSAQGQQNVRGRQERINFANSFETIYHFQNIYVSGTSYFPILGSLCKFGPGEPWVAHQRRDRMNNEGEVYIPMLSGEKQPDGESILKNFE